MFVLPVPATPPDELAESAEAWELAAPTHQGPSVPRGNEVTAYRTGPGDVAHPRDEWLGITLYDVDHEGVENGRQLFVNVPGPTPEGHSGYDDIPDPSGYIERSTRNQALFWSDWNASTALQAGGNASFNGDHVVIVRIPPGSAQGYMPSNPGMEQYNTDRNLPSPWDEALTIGGGL